MWKQGSHLSHFFQALFEFITILWLLIYLSEQETFWENCSQRVGAREIHKAQVPGFSYIPARAWAFIWNSWRKNHNKPWEWIIQQAWFAWPNLGLEFICLCWHEWLGKGWIQSCRIEQNSRKCRTPVAWIIDWVFHPWPIHMPVCTCTRQWAPSCSG